MSYVGEVRGQRRLRRSAAGIEQAARADRRYHLTAFRDAHGHAVLRYAAQDLLKGNPIGACAAHRRYRRSHKAGAMSYSIENVEQAA